MNETDPPVTARPSNHDDSHAGDLRTTYAVFVALLVLLAATVGVAYLDLGRWGLPVAMSIASAKALLILACFMHLLHESSLIRTFAIAGYLWLSLLFGILVDFIARSV